VLDEYDRLVEEFGLDVLDARASITEQQRLVRKLIAPRVAETEDKEVADGQLV
jgi:hypothetical protein